MDSNMIICDGCNKDLSNSDPILASDGVFCEAACGERDRAAVDEAEAAMRGAGGLMDSATLLANLDGAMTAAYGVLGPLSRSISVTLRTDRDGWDRDDNAGWTFDTPAAFINGFLSDVGPMAERWVARTGCPHAVDIRSSGFEGWTARVTADGEWYPWTRS